VTSPPLPTSPRTAGLNPALVGLACGLFSSVIYTCANICLRAVAHCDPFWVSCVKAVPTTLAAGVILAIHVARGRRWRPGGRTLLLLVSTGLLAQLGGNVAFQYSLGVVGLALGVPLTLGTLIIGGAVMGRVWLGEPVTPRSAMAMGVLIASILVLSLGAEQARGAIGVAEAGKPWEVWPLILGVTAACLSGLAYAVLGAVIRRMVQGETPVAVTLFVISAVGVVSLGLASLGRLGWDGMLATDPGELSRMWWAGVFNAVAFFSLTKALELAPVVHVNAVNTSQTALAGIAGIFFFNEPLTPTLAIGVVLTAIGLMLIDRSNPPVEATEPVA
jgi:drug/metabolite transporter, DME family